jgi:endonuclease YncB( thermonuclease family)
LAITVSFRETLCIYETLSIHGVSCKRISGVVDEEFVPSGAAAENGPMRSAFLLLLLSVSAPTAAQSPLTVIDGNTLQINGTAYRLWGIDAPDITQSCGDGWPAGEEATKALRAIVQGKRLECRLRVYDQFKRPLVTCRADATDVNVAMVRAGMAWADRTDRDYAGPEQDARYEKRGVHDHSCLLPWAWRARKR